MSTDVMVTRNDGSEADRRSRAVLNHRADTGAKTVDAPFFPPGHYSFFDCQLHVCDTSELSPFFLITESFSCVNVKKKKIVQKLSQLYMCDLV